MGLWALMMMMIMRVMLMNFHDVHREGVFFQKVVAAAAVADAVAVVFAVDGS